MKKFLSVIIAIMMLVASFSVVSAEEGIKVTIDGKAQSYDVMPIIENGRTLVPMRAIFESLGADISWDDATKTVTGKKADISVSLQIGNTSAKVGDKEVTLDVPAKILEGRTLVPVRFISEALGCKVDWEDATKTVIINTSSDMTKPSVKALVSDFHRPVPTTFEKSNDLNDLYYFLEPDVSKNDAMYDKVKGQGEVVCTTEKFVKKFHVQGPEYGTAEVIDVEGQPFSKALKITCTSVPKNSASFIIKTAATPEKNPGDGVKKEDVMLLAFRARCVSGGSADGVGQIQVQVEHPTSYKKALFSKAQIPKEWTIIYMPITGVDNATSIGIRGGFYEQVIELGGIEIINMGEGFDVNTLPSTVAYDIGFKDGQQWRIDANKRIENIRKGDFTVVVKDKEGNVIKDAEVELDMFEHAFEFGTAISPQMHKNQEYAKRFSENFNASVVEHYMKWKPYEENPEEAKKEVDAAINAGSKYNRGHILFWEKTPPAKLFPDKYYSDEIKAGNMEAMEKVCREHIEDIAGDYKGIFHEWDVINETIKNTFHRDIFGPEIYKKYFEWTRDVVGKDCKLYYNEAVSEFEERVKELVDMGADFDAIGIQSHYDSPDSMTPSKLLDIYADLSKYGKEMKVTEFSCGIYDEGLQANYMRDVLICAFAEEKMNGFLMWSFWDGSSYAATAPLYSKEWTMKPAGKVYQDLVYNKWWTRDAKATTNAEGKATVRGFYGDYDVTVNANGKTINTMVSFHKGYDNVLEITID